MKRILYAIICTMTVNTIHAQVKSVSRVEWSAAADLPPAAGQTVQPGVAGPVAGISGNAMIVAGGANFPDGLPWNGGLKKYHAGIYIFQRDEKGDVLPGSYSRWSLPQPVAYSANVSTPAGLIYAGGENDQGISDKVMLLVYQPATAEIQFTALPSLPVAVTNASAAYDGRTLYVGGGESVNGPEAQIFSLDLSTPGALWQTLPAIPVRISHAVMAVQDHAIYLMGGRQKKSDGISELFSTVYRYDLHAKKWTAKQPLPYPVSAGTGLAVGTQEILFCSGDKGEVFHQMEVLNAAISSEKDAVKKEALTVKKKQLMNTHPGFTKEVLLYNTGMDQWRPSSPLPMAGPVTTTAFLWNGDILIPSGEIRAGVRTPVVIRGKIVYHAE